MKKRLGYLGIMVLCLSFVSCSNNANAIKEEFIIAGVRRISSFSSEEKKLYVTYPVSNKTKGYENVSFPDYQPVIGDLLKIKYTGNIICSEDLNAGCHIEKGKVIDYSFKKTIIKRVDDLSIKELEQAYNVRTQIVVLNEEGYFEYTRFYSETTYYIAFDGRDIPDEYNGDDYTSFTIAGIYAYNPRP